MKWLSIVSAIAWFSIFVGEVLASASVFKMPVLAHWYLAGLFFFLATDSLKDAVRYMRE